MSRESYDLQSIVDGAKYKLQATGQNVEKSDFSAEVEKDNDYIVNIIVQYYDTSILDSTLVKVYYIINDTHYQVYPTYENNTATYKLKSNQMCIGGYSTPILCYGDKYSNDKRISFGTSTAKCPMQNSWVVSHLTLSTPITTLYFAGLCLTGDTLITLADYSQKRIDQLKINNKILSVNPQTLQLESDEITYTDAFENKTHINYDEWLFSDGTIIKTVHRHRFYNVEKQAMIYMDEWNIGEHAYNIQGRQIELISYKNIEEIVNHYTIFTKNQNYFANGLLSGNRYTPPMGLH